MQVRDQIKAAVKIGNELGEWFNISIGTIQGDPARPSQFIAHLEKVTDGVQNNGTGELLFKGNESTT